VRQSDGLKRSSSNSSGGHRRETLNDPLDRIERQIRTLKWMVVINFVLLLMILVLID
jgi:hypothetical protein